MKKPFILISNDDGITAPGIRHLFETIKPFAKCVIAAPLLEKSGAGLSTTLSKPLEIQSFFWEDETPAYRINGTPSDCIKLACSVILKKAPDLIISGINKGCNGGRNVLYSGTVGAVIEGVFRNIPGIAFSCFDVKDPDYENSKKYIYPIIDYILKNPFDKGSFLNVNFPPKELPILGVKMTSQGLGYCTENPDKRIHPEGHAYYWMGGKWSFHPEEKDESDIALLQKGYITAVPIKVDQLTCEEHLAKHKKNFEEHLSAFENEVRIS